MRSMTFYPAGALGDIFYVSVLARHKGKRVLCFHSERRT